MPVQETPVKSYNGGNLKGIWIISLKLDGVRALVQNGVALSRSGKPLYNLSHLPNGDYEIFYHNWETSISLVRTKVSEPVPIEYCYSLEPLDPRLYWGVVVNPTEIEIKRALDYVVSQGYEGLVLRQDEKRLKVKPIETHDVIVISLEEGKGKNKSRLGAVFTEKGRVGTGFTDFDRVFYWKNKNELIGKTIEVEAMGLTKNGKFRHPRFKRLRFDK